jgi:hypothetical protein
MLFEEFLYANFTKKNSNKTIFRNKLKASGGKSLVARVFKLRAKLFKFLFL